MTYRCAIEKGIQYSAPNGHRLRLTLYRPQTTDAQPRTGIVLIHGGAWIAGSRLLQRWYGRQFARAGMVAAAVDYRKMPRYPFPACLHDAKAAVRWLRARAGQYAVDSNRIVAMGESAGGHLALMLAATRPEDGLEGEENPGPGSSVQAAVSLYGPSDLRYYVRTRNLKLFGPIAPRFMRSFVGADPDGAVELLGRASPFHYIHAGMCPVLLIHGTRDSLVPFDQTAAFQQRMRELGGTAELVAMKNRGHAFDYIHPRMRPLVLETVLGFLDQHGLASAKREECRRGRI